MKKEFEISLLSVLSGKCVDSRNESEYISL